MAELAGLPVAFLDSAKLLAATHPAMAKYLAGYALETHLKLRIAQKLGWTEFPPTWTEPSAVSASKNPPSPRGDDALDRALRTHNLSTLAIICGVQHLLNDTSHPQYSSWNAVMREGWSPEERYTISSQKSNPPNVALFFAAVEDLLNNL